MGMEELNNTGIAIISPSGYAPDEPDFQDGIRFLESRGCRVYNYYSPTQRHERFAANDEVRAAQFYEAAENPEVQVILALRGGYGLSRLLPYLDYPRLADSGKIFVGHSDFTVFNMALLATTGTISLAGPMLCNDFSRQDISNFTFSHFKNCLKHPRHSIRWETSGNPVLTTSGTLWGGNLTMLAHLIGTPWLPRVEGGILFVEDIHEHPYRIERMLLQLLHAGVLEKQKALLLGSFSNYQLSQYDNGYDFDTMLKRLKDFIKFPIFTGLPFGHIQDKVTLAVGAPVNLISTGDQITLEMSGYPVV